ncbi:MAG TPA: hypothetical protein VFN67_33365 [Polyangiales bacterium]|nr:hypothetical protein [Polyangiales bacterium]
MRLYSVAARGSDADTPGRQPSAAVREGADSATLRSSMQPIAHSRSSKPPEHAALRALLGVSLGWLLLLAFAHTLQPGTQLPRHVRAELRLGGERPAQVADLGAQQLALQLLSTRARFTPDHPPAAPGALSVNALSLRARVPEEPTLVRGTDQRRRRAVSCTWPLPRSSCDHQEDEASRT